jgi:chlorobactene glucosyltransferase
LCFIDADVRLQPGLLTAAVSDALKHEAGLLSLHPHQEMVSFAERFLMPPAFMGLLILMDFDRINNPASRLAMANGQFIMVRRDRYYDFDGHQSVQSEVLEDVAIARNAKRAGVRIRLLAGGKMIHTRMYSSVRTVWQGLTRGAVELAGGPLFGSATIGSTLVLGWLPILLPIGLMLSPAFPADTKSLMLSLAVITAVLWYASLGLIMRWYGVPLRYLLLLPLSFSALSIAIVEGMLRYLTRRRIWKGRHL